MPAAQLGLFDRLLSKGSLFFSVGRVSSFFFDNIENLSNYQKRSF